VVLSSDHFFLSRLMSMDRRTYPGRDRSHDDHESLKSDSVYYPWPSVHIFGLFSFIDFLVPLPVVVSHAWHSSSGGDYP
jgi:hypothetical protein